MWIFLNDAMLSIVEVPDRPDLLLVRARAPGDIERVFPTAAPIVNETPERDYRYRAQIRRKLVSAVIADRVNAINYGNFKDSIGSGMRSDPHAEDRHDAYLRVWGIMNSLQNMLHPVKRALASTRPWRGS